MIELQSINKLSCLLKPRGKNSSVLNFLVCMFIKKSSLNKLIRGIKEGEKTMFIKSLYGKLGALQTIINKMA